MRSTASFLRSVIPNSMTTLLAAVDLIVCAGTVGDVNAGNASEMESIAFVGEQRRTREK